MPVWTIPIAYTLVSLIGATLLPRLEHAYDLGEIAGLAPASAIASLSAIASGMMALTGIVFSVAFVMLQFSAISYSPRFATRFARDPLLFHSLGVFFATFTYALATTNWVDRAGSGKVPVLSWAVAIMLLIASLLMFTLLIRRIGDLQIGNTLRFIGDEGRAVIGALAATPQLHDAARSRAVARPAPDSGKPSQVLRFGGTPRYIERFDFAALVALACEADGRIEMDCAVGDMVTEGTILLRVYGARSPLPERRVLGAISLGPERTFEQDPKYPIRLLVDIAIKALSPAINDPTTAVQALDQIEDLLRRLARHQIDVGRVPDANGVLRLVFPTPTWSDYLSLAFDEIRMFGVTSIQVMRRLRSALVELQEILGSDERAMLVQRYLNHIDRVIDSSALDDQDRSAARQEDPQGLGLTR
jgi:uncharacterized membrane protein